MQKELLQFKLQKVWTLVDLPKGKRAIGTKWVYRNKKDERGIVVRNKARLVAQDEFYRELTFFLGLQVMQRDDGIFISQDKYVANILKKFDLSSVKIASTPIETNKALHKDEEADDVDVYLYRSMIGSLMYLTASMPDIMFAICACARDLPFNLEDFLDSDYAGASLDRKSTIGGCQFLGKRLISWQCKKQTMVSNSTTKAEYVAAANCCGQVLRIQNQMLDYGFNFINTKIYIDNEKVGEGSGQPTDPQYTSTSAQLSNEEPITVLSSSQLKKTHKPRKAKRTTKISQSSGPIHLVVDETVYKEWEDRMEVHLEGGVKFLMYPRFVQVFLDKQVKGMTRHKEVYVTPSHTKKVFANMKRSGKAYKRKSLIWRKTAQAKELLAYRREVNNWKERKFRTSGIKVTLVDETQEMNDDNLMFDTVVTTTNVEVTNGNAPTTTIDELEIKAAKPKAVTSSATTTTTTRPKARGEIMVEPERPLKKKDQVALDEEIARNLEAQMQKKNHFATLSAEEIRRKPPTKAQKRNQMSIYLKNMAGYKHSQLKSKSYDEIQKLFDKEMKRVNTFVDMNSEVVKGSETRTEESSKRAGDKLESDKSKKQKIDEHVEAEKDDDPEEEEMKKHMEIVQDEEEIAIDAIPLATKPLMIVEYKIVKEGQKGFYHLIRADGSSKRYSSMIRMLQGIDREDLETLWKLVKEKHGINRPVDVYERVLWGDLKVMFKPDIKSKVWRNLQGYKVTVLKLFDNCGVHFVRFKNLHIFMLVEKKISPYTNNNHKHAKQKASS
ncbi:putative ribonuclease H-like domain-containing protein [Tanacetum coccineum]